MCQVISALQALPSPRAEHGIVNQNANNCGVPLPAFFPKLVRKPSACPAKPADVASNHANYSSASLSHFAGNLAYIAW